MSHTTNIGKEICRIRKERNMTIAELSKKADVSAPMIGAYENGKSLPTLRLLYKISIALNADYDYLTKLLESEKN